MKASDALAKFLIQHKVRFCFELVGGMITHLLDSMAQTGEFTIVSMHHEQAAAFSAEGIARITKGKNIAVAMGTSGPGATNMVTGIASCWLDSIPCLFLTGQVNVHEQKGRRKIRQQGFQELESVDIVKSITKYAKKINTVDILMEELHTALSCAYSGRPGPVLLDIPNNIQRENIDEAIVNFWLNKPLNIQVKRKIPVKQLFTLTTLCNQAKRPLICLGGGSRWSPSLDWWLDDLEKIDIPFVATLMGQETIRVRKNYFHLIGSYGNREANWAVQNCDLLIVIGARLDVRQTGADTNDFARNAKIIQIDIDTHQLNNRIISDVSINNSAENFFNQVIPNQALFKSCDAHWINILMSYRKKFSQDEYTDWKISPSLVINIFNTYFSKEPAHFVCDVGNHQMWAAQNIRLNKQQTIHHSGGLGAMGFALPTAIGIALQSQEKVVVLTGDGSIQINIQELDTISRLNLNILIIIFNNYSLGMVKNFQDMYFNGRNQSTKKGYSAPHFKNIAMAYNIKAIQVHSIQELREYMPIISKTTSPLLLEILMEDATECRPRLSYGDKLDTQYPYLTNR